jgi:lipoprotein-releasing system permease protein
VVAATPFIYSQVMLSSGKNVSGVVLRGMDPTSDARVTNFQKSLVEGKLAGLEPGGTTNGPEPGIIIGRELARNLNLAVGDKVSVVSPLGTLTPMGMIPKMKPFRVVGLFNTGMFEYDSTLAYVGITEAQAFLTLGDAVTGIQLRVNDVYKTGEISKEINRSLGFPYYARDWMQMNKNILFALKTEKMVMFIILTLIVLVAAFGIASTLFMVVMEKTKDIAILKSMGGTGTSIMKIFVLEGLVIGVLGTILGVLGGLLVALNLETIVTVIQQLTGLQFFSKDVYYLDHFPSRVIPADVALISITAVLISFAATLYPSWQASRLPPAQALRYE